MIAAPDWRPVPLCSSGKRRRKAATEFHQSIGPPQRRRPYAAEYFL